MSEATEQQQAESAPIAPPQPADNGPSRDDLIAGLKALSESEEEVPTTAEETEPAGDESEQAEESEDGPEEEAAADEDADDSPDEDAEESSEEAEAEPEQADDDPALRKIQQAEKRMQEKLAAQRREFEQERQAWQKQIAEFKPQLDAFEQARSRASYDAAGVLASLGVDLAEHGKDLARQIYAHSKEAADDPRTKTQAMESMQMREMRAQLEQTTKRMEEMQQLIQQQQDQQRTQQQYQQFMAATEKAIAPDSAPLIANMLNNDPDRARYELAQATEYLLEYTGEVPDHADVVAHAESQRRKELQAMGIDPESVLSPKTQTQNAQKRKAAKKSLSTERTPSTQPRPKEPMTDEEIDAMIIAKMKSGDID